MRGFKVVNSVGQVKSIGATGATGATGDKGATGAAGSDGSDAFGTIVELASEFTNDSTTFVDVTGFKFTPAANKTYIIRGQLLCRTDNATIGVRPGVTWPTGMTNGVCQMFIASSTAGAAPLGQSGNLNATVQIPVGGFANATQSWPCQIRATLVTGASVSGNFQFQLANEGGTIIVRLRAGSWFIYQATT